MAGLVLEQLSDFGDYVGGKELSEVLEAANNDVSDVRLSPDGHHVHVILRKAKAGGLVTFDKYERAQSVHSQKRLDLARTVPIVDVLYLDHNNNNDTRSSSNSGSRRDTVAVVYESGKAEFWRFRELKAGWHLLQTSDLCNSPRARVVSVCVCSSLIIWCEERPASESSPALGSTRNKFRYCVCRRDFQVEEGAVSLGGVKIALHNNPKYTVVTSGEYVHLMPDLKVKPQSISKFFLSWSPRQDSFRISATCRNLPLKRLSAKESDFKRLVTDSVGFVSTLEPPEIFDVSPTGCGGLLLLLSTGWLCLLQKDGILRQVYKQADNCLAKYGTRTGLGLYQDTVALLVGQTLHLIDVNCGRELGKMILKREGLLYVNQADRRTPHLFSETGLYMIVNQETDSRDCSSMIQSSNTITAQSIDPGALLVEAVFEEACKYYQQRSLSSTQLTVDVLRKGGRFQAPISLASILRNYISAGSRPKGAEPPQNEGEGCVAGQDKLMGSLEAELKALISLEELKSSIVKGSVKEVETLCESLVEKEVTRLLSSSELDKEALLYLNSIFSTFPCPAWRAAQAALQLRHNGEGSMSSGATADVWKTVLGPAPGSRPPASLRSTSGGQKHGYVSKCKTKCPRSASPATLPVFELLCHSVFHYQPSWLPRFLELAQQQQGSAGLGLSLASTTWNITSGRGGDGGENNVPLYKRALGVLSGLRSDTDRPQHLEVELLLVSGRPNAILQAMRVLIANQEWERVMQVADKFCKQSPLLNKEIFTALLCEVAQHRDLDPYLELLWTLCPEDLTVTTIINLVLKTLPTPNTPPSSSSSSSTSFSMGAPSSLSPAPFADSHSNQLTIGLLKPLLGKVLQRETKPSQRYADILQSPLFPPPAPPRQPVEQPGAVVEHPGAVAEPCRDLENNIPPSLLPETPEQQTTTHTSVQNGRMMLPANPFCFT